MCVFVFVMLLCIFVLVVKVYIYFKYGNLSYIDVLYVLFIIFIIVGFGDIMFEGFSRSILMVFLGLIFMLIIINVILVWFENRGSVRCIKCYKVKVISLVCSESMIYIVDICVDEYVL